MGRDLLVIDVVFMDTLMYYDEFVDICHTPNMVPKGSRQPVRCVLVNCPSNRTHDIDHLQVDSCRIFISPSRRRRGVVIIKDNVAKYDFNDLQAKNV